jgi:hypothetical protein
MEGLTMKLLFWLPACCSPDRLRRPTRPRSAEAVLKVAPEQAAQS